MMKNIIYFLFFAFAIPSFAQTHIPDKNFADAIREECPNCIDGNDNLTADAANLKDLDVSGKGIKSLDGIAGFTNLQDLFCDDNQLTILPVLPQSLQILYCQKNQLISLPALPQSLQILYCQKNQLISLPALPQSLRELYCYNNPLNALPTLPQSLQDLNCSFNQLITLPTLPQSLQDLNCSVNQLITLPTLPQNLQELYCGYNQLITLPTLPQNLQELYCGDNQLNTLPTLPQNLQELYCNNNQFISLPILSQKLQLLYCNNNQLKSLPILPQKLQTLRCYNNQLTFLPTLPQSLEVLESGFNQLVTLPSLPQNLRVLWCYNNQLISLPALLGNLQSLGCSNNQLTSLPVLPQNLKELYCSNNQLTSLPVLPQNLKELQCYDNQLSILPVLPQNLQTLKCYNNQKLSCFNGFLSIGLIHIEDGNTNIKCHPNKPIGLIHNFRPICDATNSNTCFAFPQIKGTVFLDFNDDGIKNNYDIVLTNQLMEISPYGFATTDNNGNFSMSSDTSKSLIINVKNIPSKFVVKPIERKLNTSVAFAQTYANQDFRLVPKEMFSDIEVNIVSSVQRPGFEGTLTLTYRNIGTTVLNGQIKLEKDPILLYISATPTENEIIGHTIIWNYTNLKPFESRSITVKVKVPTTTPINSKLTNKMFATFNLAGTYYESGKATELTTVVGSYDPNDKTADVKNLDPKDITARKPITYTIRFQNTGTYHAERVEVQDTISPLFDLSTLKTIAVSHPNCTVSIEKDRFKTGQPTLVKWTFENIILPDSNANEAASHGFVRFSIQPKQGLPIGTSLENKAFIYFDYNLPIITNTSKVKVEKTSKIKENELEIPLKVYPNPSSNKIFVETNLEIKGTLILSNILGQIIDYQLFTSNEISIFDIQHLPKGVYVLTLKTDKGNVSKKIVKE